MTEVLDYRHAVREMVYDLLDQEPLDLPVLTGHPWVRVSVCDCACVWVGVSVYMCDCVCVGGCV